MANGRYQNQSGIINQDEMEGSVKIVGAGAIGSFFTMTLAKMGFDDIEVFDHDSIEDHNIANQMYPEAEIGSHKTYALERLVKSFSGTAIRTLPVRFGELTGSPSYPRIFVSAVDNMDVRRQLWDWYKTARQGLFVDGRMGAQVYRAYSVDMSNTEERDFYESTLYPQSEAAPERCTQKSIIYTVLQVAGTMLAMVKQYCKNERRPLEITFDTLNFEIIKQYKKETVED